MSRAPLWPVFRRSGVEGGKGQEVANEDSGTGKADADADTAESKVDDEAQEASAGDEGSDDPETETPPPLAFRVEMDMSLENRCAIQWWGNELS